MQDVQPFHWHNMKIVLGAVGDLKYKMTCPRPYISSPSPPLQLICWTPLAFWGRNCTVLITCPVLWDMRSCSNTTRLFRGKSIFRRSNGCSFSWQKTSLAEWGLEPSLLTPGPICHLQWDPVLGLGLRDATTRLCKRTACGKRWRDLLCKNETVPVKPL